MNRKLLVIAMVPLLVGFAGAMAFSQYTGSITKTISVTTGTVEVKEKVDCVAAHITGDVVVQAWWQNYNQFDQPVSTSTPISYVIDWSQGGQGGGCPTVPSECYPGIWNQWCDPTDALSLGSVEYLGPGISSALYFMHIQYLTPGDWIELELIDELGPTSTIGATLLTTLHPSGLAPATLAAAGGWTVLPDPGQPCRTQYTGPGNANPIWTYKGTNPSDARGLEYCVSGPLAPAGTPSGIPLTATGAATTLCPFGSSLTCTPSKALAPGPGNEGYTYLLIGDDASSVLLPNSGMGLYGTLCIGTTASSPPA